MARPEFLRKKPISCGSIEMLEPRIAPATFTVTTLADKGTGTLRDALTEANANAGNDIIHFAAGLHGVLRLHSALPAITDGVIIEKLDGKPFTINGNGHFQLLKVSGQAIDVTISGLNLQRGLAQNGGAISISNPDGTVTFEECLLSGNRAIGPAILYAAGKGGAIDIESGVLVLQKTRITKNFVSGGWIESLPGRGAAYGGGIYAASGSFVSIEDSVITRNVCIGMAAKGGGIANGGTLVAKHSVISHNAAVGMEWAFGGGIYNEGMTYVENRSALIGNLAEALFDLAAGGAIHTTFRSTLTVSESILSTNRARGWNGMNGSPIAPDADNPYIANGNDGADGRGGGIYAEQANRVTIVGSTLSRNAAFGGKGGDGNDHYLGNGGTGGDATGGALYEVSTEVTLRNSTIWANTTHPGGAGIGGNDGSGQRPGKSGHRGNGDGGGLYIDHADLDAVQVTLANNSASGDGGGIYINGGWSTTIHNCTIAINTATGSGGGIGHAFDSHVDVESSIVAKNIASHYKEIAGTFVANFSLFQRVAEGTISGNGNLIGMNARLGPLTKVPGSFVRIISPLKTSPAIDHGSNPDSLTNDAVGELRILGPSIDIGAVEVQ